MEILTSGNPHDGFTVKVDLVLDSIGATGPNRALALKHLYYTLVRYADRVYETAVEAIIQCRLEMADAARQVDQAETGHVADIYVENHSSNGDKVSG